MKTSDKVRAITLRGQGKTYSEILSEIPVAKSTLSLWLRSVKLSTQQTQKITQRRRLAAQRGADARRASRLNSLVRHIDQGTLDVGKLNAREVWLIGSVLYWAEGSKQRESSLSTGVIFSNSDPEMLKLFYSWLLLLGVPDDAISFEIYVHENRKTDIQTFKQWWSKKLGLPSNRVDRVYLKKGNVSTNRKNIAELYHGLLRIRVRRSTMLNRKITGWIKGIIVSLGDGVIGNTSAFGAEDSRFDP